MAAMGTLRTSVANALKRAGILYRPDSFTTAQRAEIEQAVGLVTDPMATTLAARLTELTDRLDALLAAGSSGLPNALSHYVDAVPSRQNAIDIFEGEWSSTFPAEAGDLQAGPAPLFSDDRITWALDRLGTIEGGSVLEIGPLEGGHSYMLDRAGAASVTAVEANTRAFLRCLVAKEVLGMPSVQFLCGDAIGFLEQHRDEQRPKYDLCLASGVLYHLQDPVRALHLLTQASDRLMLWTHYYDEDVIRGRPELAVKFPAVTEVDYLGFHHRLHRQDYQGALALKSFCGGSAATSAWMTRSDILGAIEFFGFDVVDVGFDIDSANGPCFAVAARRRG
jgi:hypothetical protein